MENFLIRENTTQLSDAHHDLSREVGFSLEMGIANAIVECSEKDLQLYEAMMRVDSILDEYTQLEMDEATIATIHEAAFEQIKNALIRIIQWVAGKISALWAIIKAFFKRLFEGAENLLKKVPFNFSDPLKSPEIAWFKDGIRGKFSETLNEVQSYIHQAFNMGSVSSFFATDNAIDIYSSDINLFLKKTGLADVNEKLKGLISNTMTKMTASESVDFRSNVRALSVKSVIDKFLESIDGYVAILNGAEKETIVNRLFGDLNVAQNTLDPKFKKINDIVSAYATALLKTVELVKSTLLDVGRIYNTNLKICTEYYKRIDDAITNSAKSESVELDADTIAEMSIADYNKTIASCHVNENGRIALEF